MSADIFISYRRDDSQAITDRIYEHLARAIGEKRIFKDVDDIPIGADFRHVLDERVGSCKVLLVVIGRDWSGISYDDGTRRLEDPDDFVRIEIESGLAREDLLVVPVMVNNARMPAPDSLPESLRPLCYRNNVVVRNDPDFRYDVERLATRLKDVLRERKPARPRPQINVPRLPLRLLFAIIVLAAIAVIIGVLLNQNQQNSRNQEAYDRLAELAGVDDVSELDDLRTVLADDGTVGFAITMLETAEANLDGEQDGGPWTLFIPNDSGMENTQELKDDLLHNYDKAIRVLDYITVEGLFTYDDLHEMDGVVNVAGESLEISSDGSELYIVPNAYFISTDLFYNGGVAHIVDEVLLPDDLKEEFGLGDSGD